MAVSEMSEFNMKSSLILLVMILGSSLLFSSCFKTGRCTPESNEYYFYKSRRLDTVPLVNPPDTFFNYYIVQVMPGENMVFQYDQRKRDCPEIADDEGSRYLYFEVGNISTDYFLIKDSAQLTAAKCIVALSCECYPSAPVAVNAGSIEGTRISSKKWRIKLDLVMPWSPTAKIEVNKVFEQR